MPAKKKTRAQRTAGRRRRVATGPKKSGTGKARSPVRTGMPAPDSVIAEETFRSPTGKVYRILKTSERDEYEPEEKPSRTSTRP